MHVLTTLIDGAAKAPHPSSDEWDDVRSARVLAGPWSLTGSVASPQERPDVSAAQVAGAKRESLKRRFWTLRAQLRWISRNERTRGCGIRCVSEQGAHVELVMRATGTTARFCHLLKCGHVWTCPVCAEQIRARRRDQVMRAVVAGARNAPWRMLTLTVRHHAGDALAPLLDGLLKAWRACRQQGAVQRVWKSSVLASIRAVEITHGVHGWHPHLHVLINSDEWSDEARATLLATWRRIVAATLGPAYMPDEEHAIRWSPAIRGAGDALYLAKLGLEMTWGAKKARNGSRGVWELARAATRGDRRACALWLEYEAATKGRRALELDDRAAALADGQQAFGWLTSEFQDVVQRDALSPPLRIVEIDVPWEAMRILRDGERRQPGLLWSILRSLEREQDPEGWFNARIAALARATAPPRLQRGPRWSDAA